MMKAQEKIETVVGRRIRDFRKKRNMTLEDLAAEVLLTKGQLSKIENGLVSSPLSTIDKIAEALLVDVAMLTKAHEKSVPFLHLSRKKRKMLPTRKTDSGLIYRSLVSGSTLGRSFVPYTIIIEDPDYSANNHFFRYPGDGFVYLIRGKIEYHYDGQLRVMNAGDTITFDASYDNGPNRVLSGPVEYLLILSIPKV